MQTKPFLVTLTCILALSLGVIACRKKANTSEQSTSAIVDCQGKTEQEILAMPAFSVQNATIGKNINDEVISISKGFDNIPQELEGLAFIKCFQKLETLMFFENRFAVFTEFPEYVTEIKSLIRLDFEASMYPTIPQSIGNLVNLKRFGVTLNQNLKSLPPSLYTLPLEEIVFIQTSLTDAEKQKLRNHFPNATFWGLDH